MNIWLTLIIFAALPPMIFILSIFNKKMRSGFRESRKQVAELNSQIEDSLLGIRVVKSFTGEELEKEKLIRSVPGKGFYVCEYNKDYLKEKQYIALEQRMTELITDCKKAGMPKKDIISLVETLLE